MYTKYALVNDLKILLALEVKDLSSLTQWYDQTKMVIENIRSSAELSNSVTEDVWHYLSDADIRFKDESFKRRQEKKVTLFIENLLSQ